jgi:hypothetical protein
MARCRARTQNGAGPLCKNKVSEPGLRCFQHQGLPEAPPRARTPSKSVKRPPGRGPSRRPVTSPAHATERRRERVRKAAEYCADVVDSGWRDTVADSAIAYVSKPTADRVFRHRRRCKTLAQAAAALLELKQDIHKGIGWLTSSALAFLGAQHAVSAFAGELAANIPLPTDVKIIAVARGIQVAGIAICGATDNDLTHCQCFIDLALDLTKFQVKRLLVVAEGDWTSLARFPPRRADRTLAQ